ncbi:hypothetical protein EDC94DRAFT_25426 [Helicostylum pulchrum]|nr:hypothetical protein EDC94DRAFT_25426 [Helicostylum pulchrum]
MASTLLFETHPISTESLTPTSDCNESTPIPTLNDTFLAKTEDAFLILKDTSNLLPSPPPQELENKKRKTLSDVKVEEDLNKPQLPLVQLPKGCKWCQRCGTIETPRWRYGPGGPLSLCNACHLRWKTIGKPKEGYSSTTYPPPFYNIPKRKYGKSKKLKKSKKRDDKEQKIMKLPSPPLPPAPPSPPPPPKELTPPPTPVIIPGTCTHCNTTNTPLWRRGPYGYRTLCNACGLKWSKEPNAIIEKKSPSQDSKKSHLLHHQKQYIKHGLYSVETRLVDSKDPPCAFKINLPIHHGEFLMSKAKEFELPADILQERDLGLIKGLMADREPFFTRIRSNIFVERKPQHRLDEQAVCHCLPPTEKDQSGCGDDCINRMLFYECDPKCCPCGTKCSNTRFQRKERKKGLQVFQTDHRGWGLRTNVDIKKGELVIEYRGEIISHQLCEERMCTTYVNEKNFYFLDYCNGEVIDACTKGTEARFINHSCDPNCHIEKWSLKGESHYGVFASKDIKAHTELFYDYNFSTFNGSVESQQRCHCGSSLCRGTIGKRASGIARVK